MTAWVIKLLLQQYVKVHGRDDYYCGCYYYCGYYHCHYYFYYLCCVGVAVSICSCIIQVTTTILEDRSRARSI